MFSNQRPEWLTKESDPYEEKLEDVADPEAKRDKIDDKLDDLEDKDDVGYGGRQVIEVVVTRAVSATYRHDLRHDLWLQAVERELDGVRAHEIVNHRTEIKELAGLYIELADQERIWKEPIPDLFADRDWYVDGKNVWILQVGSKAEFGSFEAFMDRVSAARIHLDDAGDLECTYDIPKPDGSSDRLRLDYGEREFELNGHGFETGLYPRFENPFVRGGRVEWGQREYCLEWAGKSLLHDYADGAHPVRLEGPKEELGDAETIKALAIFLRTREDMDAFTVATAAVEVGCRQLTSDEVVAAGPVEKGIQHDCEWIFLDASAPRSPDMTLTISHPPGREDDDPEWQATYTLRALMGDHAVRDCAVSIPGVRFAGEAR